ncbi:HD-GYP domain-containing protein [Paenibacillus sp. YAF4_2]|uniref:HD-GYP domain-containing protein n=1 Tax=Paenibacillus sp. YAF4_2 TaxID=3233085 RepID=UPI003F9D0A14
MHNSVFFKSVINSNSLFDSMGLLGQYLKDTIGCEQICLFLMEDSQRQEPAAYSYNMLQFDINQLQQIAVQADFFERIPDGRPLSEDDKLDGACLKETSFHTIYPFHINRNSTNGTLLLCFQSQRSLTSEELQICRIIKLHMDQLVDKIYFRKQFLRQQSYESLFNTLRMKDSFTVDHCYNVAFYSSLLGEKIGISSADLEQLKLAALLHDIGKLAIPDHILMKPGRLTDEEFDVIRQHPAIGYELLKDLPEVNDILPIVRWHHERIDGKGYPDGLKGDEIPFLVRIVSLADAFDAMTSTRVYRSSLHVKEVRKQLVTNANTQFDEQLVHQFLDIIDEQMTMRTLINGE